LEGVNPINTLKFKAEGMRKFKDRIPYEVLKEIFPQKFKRSLVSEQVYPHLKRMILSGELKEGQKLFQDEIAKAFNASKLAVAIAFSRLQKNRLVITKRRVGTFVFRPLKIWIFKFLPGVMGAYFLSKMAEVAWIKR
jgi:hypothetical protein